MHSNDDEQNNYAVYVEEQEEEERAQLRRRRRKMQEDNDEIGNEKSACPIEALAAHLGGLVGDICVFLRRWFANIKDVEK